MKTNYYHHTYTRRRQTKKPRRRPLLATRLIGVSLLLISGYIAFSFGKDTSVPSLKTTSTQKALNKDVPLAWPVIGEAAIGSVEDGLLAHSSGNQQPKPMASMAKVITALAIMEKQPLKTGQAGKSYTLTAHDVANYRAHATKGGSVVPVRVGMVLTQYQAMQAMLIASSNNISDTLAERVFGGAEAYKTYAHNMLRRMGLSQTVVADASGFSSATVGTPSELVTIGIAALKNPVIAEIVAQPQAYIPGVGLIKNTNELLGDDGVIGIKTGTTNEAGSCLLFAAHYTTDSGQEATIVGVIMGDENATSLFSDSRQLLASTRRGLDVVKTPAVSDTATPPLLPNR